MNEAAALQPLFEIARVAVMGPALLGRSSALMRAGAGFRVALEGVMAAKGSTRAGAPMLIKDIVG